MPEDKSSVSQHKHAAQTGHVPITIVTVSDTRTLDTDKNASYLQEEILKADHKLIAYHLVKDEPIEVAEVLEECIHSEVRVVIFNGGTGISPRDRTYDVLSRVFEKELSGFGELFRMLSFDEIGAAAMLSRASAGIYKEKIIFSIPGSPHAVKLAWEKLILPELNHLAWEVLR